jgi:hypothetical protein
MDGRQIKIVTSVVNGDPSSALHLLAETTAQEPWERAVVATLTAYCLRAGHQPRARSGETMVERFLTLAPAPGLAVFRTRLGMAVIDVAEVGEVKARAVDHLLVEALAGGDGYVAQDILANGDLCQVLTDAQQRRLQAAMKSAHLQEGYLPDRHLERLLAGVRSSEESTARILHGAEVPPTLFPSR